MKIIADVKVPCPHCGGNGEGSIEIECDDAEEFIEFTEKSEGR